MIGDVAIAGLTKAMDSLKGAITESFGFAMQAEKASLALGMSFERANDELGGTMDGLRGDLNERFAGAIAGMEAGLQGNTAGIARLVNQQRLTGTASAKTAAAFASMEMTMGLSREATNKLASDLIDVGAEFGTSTDVLVGAINNMAESFPAQKLAGMGAEVNAAVAGLQSELGPAMSGPLNSVMKMVMDTSMEGYENLTKLGIGSVREQLAAAKSQQEAQQILKDAIGTASMNFKSVVGDASEMYASVGVATDTFGKSAIDLVTIQDAFGQRVKVERTQTEEFGNQLGVLKSEILIPLQKAFLEFFPVIKEVATIFMSFAKDVVADLVDKGKAFVETFGSTDEAVAGLKKQFEEIKPKVVDTIMSIVGVFKNVKVIVGTLIALALIPLKGIIMVIVSTLSTVIGAIVTTLTAVFSPVVLVVGAVVAIIAILHKKFGILDPLIEGLSNAFIASKNALGKMLVSLADKLKYIPGAGKLREFGESLQTVIDDTKKGVATRPATREEAIEFNEKMLATMERSVGIIQERAKERGGSLTPFEREQLREIRRATEQRQKTLEKLQNQTDEQYDAEQKKDEEAKKQGEKLDGIQDATKDTAKQTSEINEKTVGEIKTQASFLDETANALGRSIEGILGIGRDTTMEEMHETMKIVADATTKTAAKKGSENMTDTGSL